LNRTPGCNCANCVATNRDQELNARPHHSASATRLIDAHLAQLEAAATREQMVNQVRRDHEESPVSPASMSHQPESLDPSAKPAQEDHLDHAEILDHKDLRVKRVHLVTTEMPAIQETLDLQAVLDRLEKLELQARTASKDHPEATALLDKRDPLDHPARPEELDPRETTANPATPEMEDPLEHLVLLERLATRVNAGHPAKMEHPDLRVLPARTRHIVPAHDAPTLPPPSSLPRPRLWPPRPRWSPPRWWPRKNHRKIQIFTSLQEDYSTLEDAFCSCILSLAWCCVRLFFALEMDLPHACE